MRRGQSSHAKMRVRGAVVQPVIPAKAESRVAALGFRFHGDERVMHFLWACVRQAARGGSCDTLQSLVMIVRRFAALLCLVLLGLVLGGCTKCGWLWDDQSHACHSDRAK